MANYHLVILKKPYIEAILAGRKQIESRFTRTKRPFIGKVSQGDKLFLKQSSGPVCATATVAKVKNFENLTPKQITEIKQRYNQYIIGGDEYWLDKADSKFGILVWLADIEPLRPVKICKKDWRVWVILTKDNNYGLLTD